MNKAADDAGDGSELIFADIARDIAATGYSILPNALPAALLDQLSKHVQTMSGADFKKAGIGRESAQHLNQLIRGDEICWINGDHEAGAAWLGWLESLQVFLNRRLFLGLFSSESHYAHYGPGDFYKKHSDAFKGEANRVLSMVLYLNNEWQSEDGGELVIYTGYEAQTPLAVSPSFGTIVVFLSEDFPHEVLPTRRDRFSIATWFRASSASAPR
ncbi:MAG: 2OG-Fe(II) oxygenase [Gammaproteobacteria bacterium]|nr:2OG-Fe(II) oxygenase [Gammaproteobacteria bacterium]MBQ0840047.1 2OG-Fe(II) oxygenase [Gammaproteobacteria bacterium]